MTWDHPSTVARFVGSPPNAVLMSLAARLSGHGPSLAILDIGCGAGRNAIPLALADHRVTGVDRSVPMLEAARQSAARVGVSDRCRFVEAEMDRLPGGDGEFDLVVAHGVWNLAADDATFLRAIAAAGRVARPGASLFVFTFARVRQTPPALVGSRFAVPLDDGSTRCYATEADLDAVLGAQGFVRGPGPLTIYNVGATSGPPPIFEGIWTRR